VLALRNPFTMERVERYIVTIQSVPRGGEGSSDKSWIQIAAGVILVVVGIILAFTVWGAAFSPYLITAGIGLALSGALTLIFPPASLPKLKSGSGSDQPLYAITGSRNTANPWGALPSKISR
jgi:predicted phage tail protein